MLRLKREEGQGVVAWILVLVAILVVAAFIGFILYWGVYGIFREIAYHWEAEGRLIDMRSTPEYEGNLLLADGTVLSFSNHDNILLPDGKTNSADWQGKLKAGVGSCFRLQLAGPRVPLFSWLPNVWGTVKEISCGGIPLTPKYQ